MATEPVKVGRLIRESGERDAIHIAVAPVFSSETVHPGCPLSLAEGSTEQVVPYMDNPVGIVDPFLKGAVYPGQKFYMFLFPNTVTSLRHEWTHPAFDAGVAAPVIGEAGVVSGDLLSAARGKIEDMAHTLDMTYDALMKAADDFVRYGDYTVQHGDEHWRDTFPGFAEEFWRAWEVVTGEKAPDDAFQIFSCSC
jgi:hypothetical protein